MPREIVFGNHSLLVGIDAEYLTRGLGDFEIDDGGSFDLYPDSDSGFSFASLKNGCVL